MKNKVPHGDGFLYFKAPGWRQKNNSDAESISLSQSVRERLLVACAWIYMYKCAKWQFHLMQECESVTVSQ
jgi:hypothetical protein